MSNNLNTKNANTIVSIDQHARTSTLYALDIKTGEIRSKRFSDCPTCTEFISWLDNWAQGPYYFAYESGPCGFALARELRSAGYACDLIAVSTIPRSQKDKVMKDDFMDAKSLLGAISAKSSSLSCVYVPSVEAEDARDLVRQYQTISKNLRRIKQALNAFLLRHGFVYNEKTKTGKQRTLWTQDHKKWLKSIKFETTLQQEVFTSYYQKVESLEFDLKDAQAMIDKIAKTSKFSKYIDSLCAVKGIGTLTALTFCAEIDNFERFKSGRALASYLGLVPKRHDSGEKQSSGKITKCGDKTLRHSLVEGFSGVSNFSAYSPKNVAWESIPPAVRLEIEKANKRIIKRRNALKENRKNHNVIKVALAKEAACHMLFIAKTIDSLGGENPLSV